MYRTEIREGWLVTEAPVTNTPAHNHMPWLPASVPGHVHLDLMTAGVIPDPFVRLHERDVAWVDESDWVYQVKFSVVSLWTSNAYLVFNGLDTIAEIELNGELIGKTDNMFVPYEILVGDKLRVGAGAVGENILRITFRSAKREGDRRLVEWNASGKDTMDREWFLWDGRGFVRKAQYMYGWDWGPVLLSCGIWKPIELIQVPVARILDYAYDVKFSDNGGATVNFDVYVERAPEALDADLTLTIDIEGSGHAPVSISAPKESGRVRVVVSTVVEGPRRWHPNGLGEAYQYPLDITLTSDVLCDRQTGKIGLRTIEVVREPDPDGAGEGFLFRVNGIDMFAKGANWIPSNSFPSREKIGEQIRQARDAGFNMLRVWGGGLYESEEFYRQCNEYGILVWQDFGYACSYYADEDQYADSARQEAIAAVRRLRKHPSLALWCGNNENHAMFFGNWGALSPKRYLGEHIYHEVLPAVVAEEDPGRLYLPSSPFGGKDPGCSEIGDQHYWDVWHGRGDWVYYAEHFGRFVSEFGFSASCGLAAWKTCLADDDRSARSAAVRWHDKTRRGYDQYFKMIALHYPLPETLEDLVYYSQLNQADALKFGVEHYRRIKGRCWGTLFWQFNDCYPVQSWSVIDSVGEPKAAYYASKRFYAPLLLSLVRDGDIVTAWLANDTLNAVEGEVSMKLRTFDGALISSKSVSVEIGANISSAVATFEVRDVRGREERAYLHATFKSNLSSENFLFFAEPKDWDLGESAIECAVSRVTPTQFTLTLLSNHFVPHVWLRWNNDEPLQAEDNFFHLSPNQPKEIVVRKNPNMETIEQIQSALALTAFNLSGTHAVWSDAVPRVL